MTTIQHVPVSRYSGPLRSPRTWRRLREWGLGHLLLAPNLLALGVFVLWPVVRSFVLSLQRVSPFGGESRFVGAENYRRLWGEFTSGGDYWGHVKVSVIYVIGTVPVGIAIAVLIAVGLSRIGRRAAGRYQFLIVLPIVISAAVAGIVFRWMLNPQAGYVNWFLSWFGIEGPNWLANPDWAVVSVTTAVIWRNLGFNTIVALAGVMAIPSQYLEAAAVDGASAWQRLRHVILPLLSPTLFFLVIINVINSLKTFGEISILTDGGPGQSTSNLVYAMYQDAFEGTPMRGLASAQAYLLAFLILAVSVMQFAGFGKKVVYEK